MSQENPYQPPVVLNEDGAALKEMLEAVASPIAPRRPFLTFMAVTLAVAYTGFTCILIRSGSNSPDHQGGLIFLTNIPLLIFYPIALLRRLPRTFRWPIGSVLIQALNTLAMLLLEIGDVPIVLMINGMIVLVTGTLAVADRFSEPRKVEPPVSDRDISTHIPPDEPQKG